MRYTVPWVHYLPMHKPGHILLLQRCVCEGSLALMLSRPQPGHLASQSLCGLDTRPLLSSGEKLVAADLIILFARLISGIALALLLPQSPELLVQCFDRKMTLFHVLRNPRSLFTIAAFLSGCLHKKRKDLLTPT